MRAHATHFCRSHGSVDVARLPIFFRLIKVPCILFLLLVATLPRPTAVPDAFDVRRKAHTATSIISAGWWIVFGADAAPTPTMLQSNMLYTLQDGGAGGDGYLYKSDASTGTLSNVTIECQGGGGANAFLAALYLQVVAEAQVVSDFTVRVDRCTFLSGGIDIHVFGVSSTNVNLIATDVVTGGEQGAEVSMAANILYGAIRMQLNSQTSGATASGVTFFARNVNVTTVLIPGAYTEYWALGLTLLPPTSGLNYTIHGGNIVVQAMTAVQLWLGQALTDVVATEVAGANISNFNGRFGVLIRANVPSPSLAAWPRLDLINNTVSMWQSLPVARSLEGLRVSGNGDRGQVINMADNTITLEYNTDVMLNMTKAEVDALAVVEPGAAGIAIATTSILNSDDRCSMTDSITIARNVITIRDGVFGVAVSVRRHVYQSLTYTDNVFSVSTRTRSSASELLGCAITGPSFWSNYTIRNPPTKGAVRVERNSLPHMVGGSVTPADNAAAISVGGFVFIFNNTLHPALDIMSTRNTADLILSGGAAIQTFFFLVAGGVNGSMTSAYDTVHNLTGVQCVGVSFLSKVPTFVNSVLTTEVHVDAVTVSNFEVNMLCRYVGTCTAIQVYAGSADAIAIMDVGASVTLEVLYHTAKLVTDLSDFRNIVAVSGVAVGPGLVDLTYSIHTTSITVARVVGTIDLPNDGMQPTRGIAGAYGFGLGVNNPFLCIDTQSFSIEDLDVTVNTLGPGYDTVPVLNTLDPGGFVVPYLIGNATFFGTVFRGARFLPSVSYKLTRVRINPRWRDPRGMGIIMPKIRSVPPTAFSFVPGPQMSDPNWECIASGSALELTLANMTSLFPSLLAGDPAIAYTACSQTTTTATTTTTTTSSTTSAATTTPTPASNVTNTTTTPPTTQTASILTTTTSATNITASLPATSPSTTTTTTITTTTSSSAAITASDMRPSATVEPTAYTAATRAPLPPPPPPPPGSEERTATPAPSTFAPLVPRPVLVGGSTIGAAAAGAATAGAVVGGLGVARTVSVASIMVRIASGAASGDCSGLTGGDVPSLTDSPFQLTLGQPPDYIAGTAVGAPFVCAALALVAAAVALIFMGGAHALSVATGHEGGDEASRVVSRVEADSRLSSFVSAFRTAAWASRARAAEAAVTAAWFAAATLLTPTVTAGLIRGALGADDSNEDPDDRRPAAAVAATLLMVPLCIAAVGIAIVYARRHLVYVDGMLDVGSDSKTFRKSSASNASAGATAARHRQSTVSAWAKIFRKAPPADARGWHQRFGWYFERAWRRLRRYLLRPRGEWAHLELQAESAARIAVNSEGGGSSAKGRGSLPSGTQVHTSNRNHLSSAAAELQAPTQEDDGRITGATLCMPLVDDYTRDRVWFACVELVVQLALGVAGAAAELAERGMVSCVTASWAAVGPLAFYLAVLISANPHRTRLGYYSALVPNAIIFALSLAMTGLIQSAYDGDFLPDGTWLEVLVLWVETTAVVQAIYGLTLQVLALVESWRWRRTLDLARRTRTSGLKRAQTRLVLAGSFQAAVLRIFGAPKAPTSPPPPPPVLVVEEQPASLPQQQRPDMCSVSSSSTAAAAESDDDALDPLRRGVFRRFERWLESGDDAQGTNERVVRLLHC